MSVPTEQVETLRAYLAGNREEYQRRYEQMNPTAVRESYPTLVEGACYEAVNRRFSSGSSLNDVIEFVGEVRSRSDAASELDPQTAELLIQTMLGNAELGDIDDKLRLETEIILLAALIGDEQFDDAGLDDFMARARKHADYLLS